VANDPGLGLWSINIVQAKLIINHRVSAIIERKPVTLCRVSTKKPGTLESTPKVLCVRFMLVLESKPCHVTAWLKKGGPSSKPNNML